MSAIMLQDLARMAKAATPQLAGRGSTDPNVLADYEFLVKNGISRSDYAERERHRARDAAQAGLVAGYEGEPPSTIVSSAIDALSATPQRARLARFIAWRGSVAGELAALKATQARLQAAIDAPEALKARRSGLLRDQANRLLEFIGLGKPEDTTGFDVLERRTLDAELDSAEHKSEVARIAIDDIAAKIAAKEAQLYLLIGREKEFVNPALREHAERYIPAYVAAIEKLREAIRPLAGLDVYLFDKGVDVALPEFGSLKKWDIRIQEGDDAPWEKLALGWGATPPPPGFTRDGFYILGGDE